MFGFMPRWYWRGGGFLNIDPLRDKQMSIDGWLLISTVSDMKAALPKACSCLSTENRRLAAAARSVTRVFPARKEEHEEGPNPVALVLHALFRS
jgi:hypothetical protein